ncbi:BnaC09g00280D [Brassica napus]|uniref:BnaC09g00280D protein n=1 Tax=Brassica napus TaxID=3708 RepID=A0A078GA83_BRANA|nr:BnaC09g00280D [Brassica napus]
MYSKLSLTCQTHHGDRGLTKKVLSSTISERQAEQEVIKFVKKHKYMPDLAALFPHVLVDVSSVKSLCTRWFPRDKNRAPAKKNNHRAMDDIRESIKELKYYKETIFKANKGRR